jgi:hypothetical protein
VIPASLTAKRTAPFRRARFDQSTVEFRLADPVTPRGCQRRDPENEHSIRAVAATAGRLGQVIFAFLRVVE